MFKRLFTLVLVCLTAGIPFSVVEASGATFDTLPNDFIYLECGLKDCTDNDLRSKVSDRVYAQGPGRYTYLVGNVATGNIFVIHAYLRDTYGGEPGYPTVLTYNSFEEQVAEDIRSEFSRWSAAVRQFDFEFDYVPPSASDALPTVPDPHDIGARSSILRFINQRREIIALRSGLWNRIYSGIKGKRTYVVTINFEDGSSGKWLVEIVDFKSINVKPLKDFVDKDGNEIYEDPTLDGESGPVTMLDSNQDVLSELQDYLDSGAGYQFIEPQTASVPEYKCYEGPNGKQICEIVRS